MSSVEQLREAVTNFIAYDAGVGCKEAGNVSGGGAERGYVA